MKCKNIKIIVLFCALKWYIYQYWWGASILRNMLLFFLMFLLIFYFFLLNFFSITLKSVICCHPFCNLVKPVEDVAMTVKIFNYKKMNINYWIFFSSVIIKIITNAHLFWILLNQIWILITFFRLIWYQTGFRLVSHQSIRSFKLVIQYYLAISV